MSIASNIDIVLAENRQRVTRAICEVASGKGDIQAIAAAVDDLNKSWDQLTDLLVLQRDERDKLISKLLNQLAETNR